TAPSTDPTTSQTATSAEQSTDPAAGQTAAPATQSTDPATAQTAAPAAQSPDQNTAPSDANTPTGTAGAQAPAPQPTPRPAAQTPGVRAGSVNITDKVTMGGYGSVRYETNSLKEPNKPAGFDFRRFVLATDATPSDRLQAYIELEFERLGEIEIEK